MALTAKSWWFRPGRLEKGGRKNPGILAVENKYEFVAHESSKNLDKWLYICKYRRTPKVMCPARARVSLFESKWIVQHIDDKHTCEPDSGKVIANYMKHRMKEEMRKNPSQPCGEAVRKIRIQAASEYAHDENLYNHVVAEMGTDRALEKQVLRIKHEVIGPTPRTRNQFNPANFLEKMFGDSGDDDIIILDSNEIGDN